MKSLVIKYFVIGDKGVTSPALAARLCPFSVSDTPRAPKWTVYTVIHWIPRTDKGSGSRAGKGKEWCACFYVYILMARVSLFMWAPDSISFYPWLELSFSYYLGIFLRGTLDMPVVGVGVSAAGRSEGMSEISPLRLRALEGPRESAPHSVWHTPLFLSQLLAVLDTSQTYNLCIFSPERREKKMGSRILCPLQSGAISRTS